MKLINTVIKSAKPKEKPYSLPDGHGLVLYVQPSGAKWWRYRYRFKTKYGTKAKMLSLGTYPDVSLSQAREIHAKFRVLLNQGIDPSDHRKQQQVSIASEDDFESVARAWWDHWKAGVIERHSNYTIRRLEADVFPELGAKQMNDITVIDIVTAVQKIEKRGTSDLPKRLLTIIGQIYRYAIAHKRVDRNPVADIKPSDILKSTKKQNFARIDENELPELLHKIDNYDGRPLTKLAVQLMALTFVRTGELIGTPIEEINLDKKQWRISAERMKMDRPHIVPLSRQSIEVLKQILKLVGDYPLLFPNERRNGKSMSNNTILYALYRMGYHSRMTGHGFRSVASTILHERGYEHKHIELQLAHIEHNEVSAAYNHALYIKQRADMMQDWADYLDEMRLKIKMT